MISRRVLWVFLGITCFTLVELGWWITFHTRSSVQQVNEALSHLELERALATELIALQAQVDGPNSDHVVQLLHNRFPKMIWTQSAAADLQLGQYYPGYRVQVDAAEVARLQDIHNRRIRMLVSEGGFFLVIVLIGAWLVFRTMRHEINLGLQQANFLSAVTHELKSPLASLRLYTETMQMREVPSEKRQHYFSLMRQDIDRLETLVGNVLAVARLEGRAFVMHKERLDFVAGVVQVLQSMRADISERGVHLDVQMPDEAIWVMADAGALQTIVRNLVDNAVKYSRGEQQRVVVSVRAEAGEAVLAVRDFGIGLNQDETHKIFQKFYRVGNELVRQAEGSGLGLFLVKSLVEQSGGKVEAISAGADLGSLFEVRWPQLGERRQ